MTLNAKRFIEIKTPNGIREFDLEGLFGDYYSDLDVSVRPFGTIFKCRNYNFELYSDLYPKEEFRALEPSKDYVVSEILLKLDPHKSTVMMSHEKELYEIAEVLEPAYVVMRSGTRDDNIIGREIPVRNPVRIVDSDITRDNLPYGFYHRLENPHLHDVLVHITTIAEWDLSLDKNGKSLEYGFNRPPNSWSSTL